MPAVSVVIPAFNAARYVGDAVDSVLEQSFRDVEVIVVDDGSTDDTAAVVSRYSRAVGYVRQENQGVAVARNRGIQSSTGRYVAFLDADDTWVPAKLDLQLQTLAASCGRRVVYSAQMICSESLETLAPRRSIRRGSILEDLLLRGNIVGSPSTVLCERSLFFAVGGFDPMLSQCADWDMWIRLASATDFLYVDQPLATYRQHGTNMSRDAALLERDSLRVLEKGFRLPSLPLQLLARRRRALGRNYIVLAGTYFYARRYRDFLRCATRGLMLDPRQAAYLAAFPLRASRRLCRGGRPTGQWHG